MVRLFLIGVVGVAVAAVGCRKSDGLLVAPTVGTIATLQGTVIAADTYAPVGGVEVSIQGVQLMTGSDGTYAVSGLKPGSAILTAERAGFQPFAGEVSLDGAVTYNFLMVPNALRSAGG
jgi:hypothetical protein